MLQIRVHMWQWSQPDERVTDKLHVAAATRREGKLRLDNFTVITYRRQFSVYVLLLAGGFITLREAVDHAALSICVPVDERNQRLAIRCASETFTLFLR